MSNWKPNYNSNIKPEYYEYDSEVFPPDDDDAYVYISKTGVIHRPNDRTSSWNRDKRVACSVQNSAEVIKVKVGNIRPCKGCWGGDGARSGSFSRNLTGKQYWHYVRTGELPVDELADQREKRS